MENFIKTLLIPLLMSGSFMTNAMQGDQDDADLEAGIAASLGMSAEEYRASRDAEKKYYQKQPKAAQKQPNSPVLDWSDEYLARQLAAEEKEQEERERQEQASLELIRYLQAEEEQKKWEREEQTTADLIRRLQIEGASFKNQISNKTQEYSKGTKRPILEEFIKIFNYLKSIPQTSDVHVLDSYVFGSHKKIDSLLEIGRLYDIDNPKLTLAEVGQQMVTFVNNHADFFKDYKYERQTIPSQKIIEILNAHFSNMDAEIRTVSPAAREAWSRAWTLALKLYNEDDASAIQIIFDQAVEGHVTRGGCIQGRIDRGFVGYVSLLAKAGVNLY